MNLLKVMPTCVLLFGLSVLPCNAQAQVETNNTDTGPASSGSALFDTPRDPKLRKLFSSDPLGDKVDPTKTLTATKPSATAPQPTPQPTPQPVPTTRPVATTTSPEPPPTGPASPSATQPAPVPAALLSGAAAEALQSGIQPRQSMGQVLWTNARGCVEPGCFKDILQAHRPAIIGEFLYLHARNVDVPYATPVDGIGATAVPTGPSSMAAPTYQPGFRIGLNRNLTDSSSLAVNYWFYQSQSTGSTTLPGGSGFLNAELVHPNTTSVAADSLSAQADYDIDFDIIDVHYRTTLSEKTYLMYLTVGARYARIDEDFRARYSILSSTDVVSDIGFDGVGPRLGLEIERAMDGRFHMYLRGGASLLFGHFQADYRQSNVFSGTQATAGLDDSRLVPVTELELGLGWDSSTETFRFAAGYYVGTWFNTVTTGGFIDSVQDGTLYSIGGVGDTLVFDGMVARIEIRY